MAVRSKALAACLLALLVLAAFVPSDSVVVKRSPPPRRKPPPPRRPPPPSPPPPGQTPCDYPGGGFYYNASRVCVQCPNECANFGYCSDGPSGTGACICPANTTGSTCATCRGQTNPADYCRTDINLCIKADGSPSDFALSCPSGLECVPNTDVTPTTASCECPLSPSGNAIAKKQADGTCVDINECLLPADCNANPVCNPCNTIVDYVCDPRRPSSFTDPEAGWLCNPYLSNATYRDPRTRAPRFPNGFRTATCQNLDFTAGGYNCSCKPGWVASALDEEGHVVQCTFARPYPPQPPSPPPPSPPPPSPPPPGTTPCNYTGGGYYYNASGACVPCINECANFGYCSDGPTGTGACICPANTTGATCATCRGQTNPADYCRTDINLCIKADGSPSDFALSCPAGLECVPNTDVTPTTASCECPLSPSGNAIAKKQPDGTCVDINECLLPADCNANPVCNPCNTIVDYVCDPRRPSSFTDPEAGWLCNPYLSNATYRDPKTRAPKFPNGFRTATCRNLDFKAGGYNCTCKPGWRATALDDEGHVVQCTFARPFPPQPPSPPPPSPPSPPSPPPPSPPPTRRLF